MKLSVLIPSTIVVIMFISLTVFFAFIWEQPQKDETIIEYDNYQKLEFKISPEEQGSEFSVNFPVLEFNDSIPSILNELTIIKGNGSFELQEVDGMTVLSVTSRGYIIISAEMTETNLEISPTEEYLEYIWTTDPEQEVRSNKVEIRGSTESDQSQRITINIFFNSRSNYYTDHASYRTSKFDGQIKLNDKWTAIGGTDKSLMI